MVGGNREQSNPVVRSSCKLSKLSSSEPHGAELLTSATSFISRTCCHSRTLGRVETLCGFDSPAPIFGNASKPPGPVMNDPPQSRKERKEEMRQERERRQKERLELKREHDVFLLYGAAFRDIPHLDQDAGKHVPRPSPDSTLTALCQLAAIRLGCQRCMVSLIDDSREHILAEATCDLSLRPEAPGDAPRDLWLGNVSIPRAWGLGEKVLDLDSHEDIPVLVANNLKQDDNSSLRAFVKSRPDAHFIASAALLSPAGAIVGTLCVFDNKSRDGMSKIELRLLQDLAKTIVNYLDTYTLKDQYRRGERFTRGLTSFADGASVLQPIENNPLRDTPALSMMTTDDSSVTEREVPSADDVKNDPPRDVSRPPSAASNRSVRSQRSKSARAKSARHRSIRTLQDTILPLDSKSMFSRAASILLASSDLDGVLILDASVAANGQRRTPAGNESGTEPPSESYHSRSSSSEDEGEGSSGGSSCARGGYSSVPSSSKMCQVLGVATNAEYGSLLEPDLARLLHEHSHGRIFTLTATGLSMSSNEESAPSSATDPEEGIREAPLPPKRKTATRAVKSSKALQAMFPGARTVAFVPFWDYERSRWFAGCLCWSNSPHRLLSASVDLAYFKIFSHSIMRELSRLDAVANSQVCSTLCLLYPVRVYLKLFP